MTFLLGWVDMSVFDKSFVQNGTTLLLHGILDKVSEAQCESMDTHGVQLEFLNFDLLAWILSPGTHSIEQGRRGLLTVALYSCDDINLSGETCNSTWY
eukprot:1151327-Pelagomonas_calceolata.AAC.2